jgi:ADP-dependent NAD(P)H-hydrate dehydratase / NAD(P)H-hydrate epimerase
MKPVLSPDQARELDRATQALGMQAEVLMERAGRAVAQACLDLCGGSYGRRAVVVCGKGNNGGDGLVAARHLSRSGMAVAVVLLEAVAGEPATTALRRLRDETLTRVVDVGALERELERADVAVDAIFGTGFHGMPEDPAAVAIAAMNAAAVPVVAVDIPSGVDGTSGAVGGDAVLADLTVTFGAAKTGVVLLPGASHAGAVRVVDIGFAEDQLPLDVLLAEPADVASILPVRPVDAHKRQAVLLVVAGSRGMTGAPRLIAGAAARMGTGLVQVAAPASALPAIQAGLTEAIFVALAETGEGTLAADAADAVLEALDRATAVAIGPGLTVADETAGVIRRIVAASPVPSVIDADALNAFAGAPAGLAGRRADAVLTPHAGEFTRLTGVKARDLANDRLGHVRELASATRAVSLLKGSRSVIAAPDGRAWINVTGSSALATAGTGDVLTGMIGGLLARGLGPAEAAWAGAYLHGLAGSLAGREAGDGVVAGDLIPSIPRAVAHIEDHR